MKCPQRECDLVVHLANFARYLTMMTRTHVLRSVYLGDCPPRFDFSSAKTDSVVTKRAWQNFVNGPSAKEQPDVPSCDHEFALLSVRRKSPPRGLITLSAQRRKLGLSVDVVARLQSQVHSTIISRFMRGWEKSRTARVNPPRYSDLLSTVYAQSVHQRAQVVTTAVDCPRQREAIVLRVTRKWHNVTRRRWYKPQLLDYFHRPRGAETRRVLSKIFFWVNFHSRVAEWKTSHSSPNDFSLI